jgi:hypothetical protein
MAGAVQSERDRNNADSPRLVSFSVAGSRALYAHGPRTGLLALLLTRGGPSSSCRLRNEHDLAQKPEGIDIARRETSDARPARPTDPRPAEDRRAVRRQLCARASRGCCRGRAAHQRVNSPGALNELWVFFVFLLRHYQDDSLSWRAASSCWRRRRRRAGITTVSLHRLQQRPCLTSSALWPNS